MQNKRYPTTKNKKLNKKRIKILSSSKISDANFSYINKFLHN